MDFRFSQCSTSSCVGSSTCLSTDDGPSLRACTTKPSCCTYRAHTKASAVPTVQDCACIFLVRLRSCLALLTLFLLWIFSQTWAKTPCRHCACSRAGLRDLASTHKMHGHRRGQGRGQGIGSWSHGATALRTTAEPMSNGKRNRSASEEAKREKNGEGMQPAARILAAYSFRPPFLLR